MEALRKVHGNYLVPEKQLFQDGDIPAACGPHGKGSQGLLSICRYELNHRAITPEDLAKRWHGRGLRVNENQGLLPMSSDLVKFIVSQNRSHFAYVRVMQLQSDNSEREVECVSATLRTTDGRHGRGVHPEYTRDGQPVHSNTDEVVSQDRVHRRRTTFAEGPNVFPTLPVPECRPPLDDEVMALKLKQRNAERVVA